MGPLKFRASSLGCTTLIQYNLLHVPYFTGIWNAEQLPGDISGAGSPP
jgi:hypothetical protein